MIYSDIRSSDSDVGAKWLGSLLVIIACMLYAITNIITEFIVKNRDGGRLEYLVCNLTPKILKFFSGEINNLS